MINFHVRSVLLRSVPELEHAAGIGRDNGFGLTCGHGLHLLFKQVLGHLGMGNVVYTRAAATPVGAFHFVKLEVGNRSQQVPRLAAYALAVGKMTGILISDGHFQGGELAHKAEIAEKLRGIFDDRAESLRFLRIERIFAQQITVLLHRGAATGGVDDDGLNVGVQKGVNVLSGHCLGRDTFTVVRVQSTAASLSLRKDDFAAVASEHAHGGCVYIAEEQRHHAAVQHGDFGSALADGRQNSSVQPKETLRDWRQHRFQLS